MNKLKNLLSGFAFVFALVASFAFTAPTSTWYANPSSGGGGQGTPNCVAVSSIPQGCAVQSGQHCRVQTPGPDFNKFLFNDIGCTSALKKQSN